MKNYFKIRIFYTAQKAGRDQRRYRSHDETLYVPSLEDAKSKLKHMFGSCKRSPMFRDKADGSAERLGWVFHYKEQQKDGTYYMEAWAAVSKILETTPFDEED